MWMARPGLPMIFCACGSQNKSTFHPLLLYDAKTIPFVPSEKMSRVFLRFFFSLSFNSCGTHLPVFWMFSVSCSRSKATSRLTPNCSATCFCVYESSLSCNACNSTSWNYRKEHGFPCSFVSNIVITTFETPKRSSQVYCDGECSL